MLVVIALSSVKFCEPCENSFHYFHDQDSCAPPISPCYASTLKVSIVSFINPIKIKLHMWCDICLQKYPSKRDMGYEKKEEKKERHMLKAL